MKVKHIAIMLFSVAVIVASVAAIVVSNNRATAARALAEREAAAADKAQAMAKAEKAKTDAEAEKRRAAEAKQKTAEEERATADANRKAAADSKVAAEDNRKAKEAESATARANSEAARAKKAEADAALKIAREEKDKAKALAEAETLKAQAEADKLAAEKLKSDRIIAEAKALELRQIDFQTLERDLMEWKLDLEEREKALKPEKTIADLSWVGGDEDMEVGENGTVRVKKKEPYRAENDRTLPKTSRKLAKTERIVYEKMAEHQSEVRESVVKSLEKLYVDALKEDRVVDADFYRKSIKSLYPDWEFKGEEKKEDTK